MELKNFERAREIKEKEISLSLTLKTLRDADFLAIISKNQSHISVNIDLMDDTKTDKFRQQGNDFVLLLIRALEKELDDLKKEFKSL